MMNISLVIFGLLFLHSMSCTTSLPSCDSEIYCQGIMLHTVQMAKLYPDSKTFVDMKVRTNSTYVLENFKILMKEYNNTPSTLDIQIFVNKNFESAGQEFQEWIPEDWKEMPSFINQIRDSNYKSFAIKLNHIWKELGRKIKAEVQNNTDLYSIIWVPNPVIVPGGRFREFYYWDSYWIIQGLLRSEMYRTVRGMLSNFAYIINIYRHIPNGGRIYYSSRSQPPLFIPMVAMYESHTEDFTFVAEHITSFDREFEYWVEQHTRQVDIDGKSYALFAYGDKSLGPRPESYSEDYELASLFATVEEKEAFYSEIKASAESGLDFSSKWFISNGTNIGNLTNIKTRSIIPVDLNAIMYWNADILSRWHERLGNKRKSCYYGKFAETLKFSIEEVFWHDEIGIWLDYDIQNAVKRDYFYATNLFPLWTGCYDKAKKHLIAKQVLAYLKRYNIDIYPGGVPASLKHTSEQWDFPNAWPNLQHIIVVGLNATGDEDAARFSHELADKWMRSNYKAYNETKNMYEKYDATRLGGHGNGGEYDVQLGFGWTNGVILDLLYRYGDDLTYINNYIDKSIYEYSTDFSCAKKKFHSLIPSILVLLTTYISSIVF